MKDFDTFSFKAHSEDSRPNTSRKSIQPPPPPHPPKNWRQMTYRFEKPTNYLSSQPNRSLVYENHYINQKISKVDEQLSQNIRRRIQLQKKLYKQRQDEHQRLNDEYFHDNNAKKQQQVEKVFVDMQKRTDKVQKLLQKPPQQLPLPYRPAFQKLMEKQSQKIETKRQIPKITNNNFKKVVPNQVKVQQLLKKITFPQIPRQNLQKLQKQIYQLSLNSDHSDITFLLMAINFHLGCYNKVRKYFREIQMFKVFQPKAFWIACETEYELEGYQLCIKLADICMKELSDEHFPRFVFLQARCYEKIGNYVNSIVCYNQIIKIRPKVAELYLQRAMIYDKIGYPKQAKEDYCYFGVLQPQARQYLKQKIMQSQNEVKRKQLIKALAKIS